MEFDVPVYEVMSFPVITVSKDMSVYDVANILKEKNIGAVVVVEDNKPIGIITERDIVREVVANNLKPKDVLVEDVMRKKVITIEHNKSINDAAKIMAKYNVKRLPVVKDGELVGIITQSDIVKISPKLLEIVIEYANIMEPPKVEEKDEWIEGICECCGYQGLVKYYQGRYLCEECLEDLKKE
ncbi:cyclic nucleotide-binding/CBS domain-containing protein [Methanocaldococcus indicus]|uniref:CBS domain-containing protein n=1 Tax=Methanocaldococcus indicus TaxID=213231 RepID=UPI003C6D874E